MPRQLTELLYVKGVTRQMLMGIQSAIAGNNEPDAMQRQRPSIDAAGDLVSSSAAVGVGWTEFLTLHSAERNRNRAGQPRIFLNAGSLTQLEQQLAGVLPENLVRYVLLARIHGVTTSAESQAGVEPSAVPFSSSMVPAFRIASLADLIDSVVPVLTPSGTIAVQSPLQTSSPEFASLAARLFDLTTVHAEPVIYGRINLHSASETVLRTIPGLTPEVVTQLLTQRDTLEMTESDSAVWLLSRNVLDLADFRRVFPELTTGGDVFQGEIIVHRAIGGPMLRRNLILDAASSPVRRVQWVDLTESPMRYSEELLLPRL